MPLASSIPSVNVTITAAFVHSCGFNEITGGVGAVRSTLAVTAVSCPVLPNASILRAITVVLPSLFTVNGALYSRHSPAGPTLTSVF
ncbi:hypothetical protein D3C76_1704260 [compost metagenome]